MPQKNFVIKHDNLVNILKVTWLSGTISFFFGEQIFDNIEMTKGIYNNKKYL